MSLLEALVLGLVQGLTEFIPISSSGHLTLVPFIVGWDEPGLAFSVALHLGTLAAVTAVYKERVAALARTALGWKSAPEADRALLRLVLIASVPAAIVGAALNGPIGRIFERPVLTSLFLGVTGYFLMSSETVASQREEDEQRTSLVMKDAAVIGVAQAVAILPGISRSGSTIGTAMRLGITREAAAHFSFLMSIPIIFGAILVEIPDMVSEGFDVGVMPFLIGIVTAGVSGFLSIRWFIGVLTRKGLKPFGVYCFFAMVAGLITALARG